MVYFYQLIALSTCIAIFAFLFSTNNKRSTEGISSEFYDYLISNCFIN